MLRSLLLLCAVARIAHAELPAAVDSVSGDGKRAVACNTELTIYDLPDGKATKWKWTTEDLDVACDRGSLSPDGTLLAIRVSPPSAVRVLHLPTKKQVATLKVETPHHTRFSADGKLLAIDTEGEIELYDLRTRKRVAQIAGNTVPFEFAPKGDLLAIGQFGELQLVDRTGAIKKSTKLQGAPAALAFSPDGTQLAVGMASGLSLYSAPAVELVASLDTLSSRESLLWSTDGKRLVAAGVYDASSKAFDGVRLYDVAAKKQLGAMHGVLHGACGTAAALLGDRASKLQCVKLDPAAWRDPAK